MIIRPIPGKYKVNQKFDISIVIPMYNSKDVIEEQIRRWPAAEREISTEIIYVDDKCPEHSSQAVMKGWTKRPDKHNFDVKLVLNQTNRGFAGACNKGAYYAKGEIIIFLNADTVPEPFWLEPILKVFKKNSKAGIVGNLQLKEGGDLHGTIDSAGSEWNWGETNFLHIGRHIIDGKYIKTPVYPKDLPPHLNCISEREMVTGCCLAIRKHIFDYIGGFDLRYKIGYWEDSELNMMVRNMGYNVMFTPDSIIWHKLSHAKVGKHHYADLNKQLFMNKWDNSGILNSLVKDKRPIKRPEVKKILIKRAAANGDVLISSGVAAALKKQYPSAEIHFCTLCPKVLANNPYIDQVIDEITAFNNLHRYQRIIDLNYIYERRPNVRLDVAYAQEAFVPVKDLEYYVHCETPNTPIPDNAVVMHAGITDWVGRNWHSNRFEELAQKIMDEGRDVICIGKGADRLVPCTIDLRSKISFFEMNHVIKNAALFIGIDSMPMHIAQLLNKPGVAFFGCVNPELRILNENMTAVTAPNLACLGCHHRQLPPCVTLKTCETGTLDCENKVTVEQVWNQVAKKLSE